MGVNVGHTVVPDAINSVTPAIANGYAIRDATAGGASYIKM
jgi:hypothetical protein